MHVTVLSVYQQSVRHNDVCDFVRFVASVRLKHQVTYLLASVRLKHQVTYLLASVRLKHQVTESVQCILLGIHALKM